MAERKLVDDSGEDQHTGQDGRDPRYANATPSAGGSVGRGCRERNVSALGAFCPLVVANELGTGLIEPRERPLVRADETRFESANIAEL
jgi:hypothetical protein